MPSVLLIGASRGIGLELARQYRENGWRVIATARSPEGLSRLQSMGVKPCVWMWPTRPATVPWPGHSMA